MAFLNPSANNTDQVGESGAQWAAIYGQTIFQNGAQVANLAGPTFTGVPAAPTAALDVATTQLATTAFVQNQLAKAGGIAGAAIVDDSITNGKLAEMAAWTIKARNAGTTGDPEDVALAGLTEEGTPEALDFALGFLASGELRKFDLGNMPGANGITAAGTATLTNKTIAGGSNTITGLLAASYATGSVTNAKLDDMAAWSFKGRNLGSTGVPENIALADLAALSPTSGDFCIGFASTGELRKFDVVNMPVTATGITAGGAATLTNKTISGSLNTITALPTSSLADDAVTNAKLANMAAWTLKGNATAGSTDPADFDIDDLVEDSGPSSASWMMVQLPTGEFRKTALTDAGTGYTNENAIDAVGGAMTDGESITFTFSDPGDSIAAEIDVKITANLAAGTEGELGYDADGAFAILGTTSKTAGRGDYAPTSIQKDALDNVTGTPAAGNPFILSNLSDLTTAEPVTGDDFAVDIAGTGLQGANFEEIFWNRYERTGLRGGTSADLDAIATAARTLTKTFNLTDTDAVCRKGRDYRLETKTLIEFAVTVNATTNLCTSATHSFAEDQEVEFFLVGASTLPGNLVLGTKYFIIASGLSATEFKVSATVGGSEIDILDVGTGTFTVMPSVEPFLIRPTDYEVGVNVRAWNLVSEGTDKLFYQVFGPTESLTAATHTVAYAEHDMRVCQVGANLYVAPSGTGTGTVTIQVEVDGVAFLNATADITAIGQTLSVDIDTTEFVEAIIRQGQKIDVIISDVGGSVAATGLDVFFLGDGE